MVRKTSEKNVVQASRVVRELRVKVFEVIAHFVPRLRRANTSHCTQAGGVRRPLSQSCTVRTLRVGAILAAASLCDSWPRAVENSFDQSISYVSFVLATANDHERLARLSRSDGRQVRAKSALRLPPVTFLRLNQVFHDGGGI